MAAKEVQFHDNARARIIKGVNVLADAVKDAQARVTVIFITNRTTGEEPATRANLAKLGVEVGEDDLVIAVSESTRRYQRRFNVTPQIYDCVPSAGAGEIENLSSV